MPRNQHNSNEVRRMNEIGCLDDSGAAPQALDILAGLAFLGISKTLRDEVQRALSDITQASGVTEYPHLQTNVGSIPSLRFGKATDKTTSPLTTGSDRESALQRKVAELDQKMGMSRSIMKKLYHKNVELEKELAIVKANHCGVDLTPATSVQATTSHVPIRPSTAAAAPGVAELSPASQALQERDLTIRQMQLALEASRRRCALLEMQLGSSPTGPAAGAPGGALGGSTLGRGGCGGGGSRYVNPDSLRDMLAQSALHHQKYRQIREDYNRLLNKRASALQSGSRPGAATAVAARSLVGDLQHRLAAEVQEREAEAALYSAKIYESEKAMSDWYVEKRLLEAHITRLNGELAERDKVDGDIEGCVTSMMERLREVEAENEQLRSQLAGALRAGTLQGQAGGLEGVAGM